MAQAPAKSAPVPARVSAAHTAAPSTASVLSSRRALSPMRKSCSASCSAADFHTRPTAVKYPDREVNAMCFGNNNYWILFIILILVLTDNNGGCCNNGCNNGGCCRMRR